MTVRLHVNIDHVATLRQARGTAYPDPLAAARVCEDAGADGITVHLREDRRHIQDADVVGLRAAVRTVLNLEMAATPEMVEFALSLKPDVVTLVPERRMERTTEGGLDVVQLEAHLGPGIGRLTAAGIAVSLFIDPELRQVDASKRVGAALVELHTGDYAHGNAAQELARLSAAAHHAAALGLRVAAGHGLTVGNVGALVQAVPEIAELNIGHAIVSDAVMVGMAEAVHAMRRAMTGPGR